MPRQAGFTLLEVIIALAILAFTISVLGEVSRLSMLNARRAAVETEAALVAESVLAELESGTAALASFSGEWVEEESQQPAEWSYQVTIDSTTVAGLLQAAIVVTEIDPGDEKPIAFSLVRWFQDPSYLEQLAALSDSGS